jgi:ATP-dependent Clp protease ATP-binding subunit ClpA
VFDRYTFPARRVIFHARRGATRIGGAQIDAELLLWGLAQTAPELLDELGAGDVCSGIEADRAGVAKASESADLPLSPCALRALQAAEDEAQRLGSKPIRLVHLLLGVLADRRSSAGSRLGELGIVSEQVRALAREPRILALDDQSDEGAPPPRNP